MFPSRSSVCDSVCSASDGDGGSKSVVHLLCLCQPWDHRLQVSTFNITTDSVHNPRLSTPSDLGLRVNPKLDMNYRSNALCTVASMFGVNNSFHCKGSNITKKIPGESNKWIHFLSSSFKQMVQRWDSYLGGQWWQSGGDRRSLLLHRPSVLRGVQFSRKY